MKKSEVWKSKKEFLMNQFSFLGLILLFIFFLITTKGQLIRTRNLMNIFNNFFSIGLSSVGVIFLMSLGDMDLSVGATLGLAAAMGAIVGSVNTAYILPVCLLTGLIIGVFNGIMISRLKVASFIGTLAVSFVCRGMMTTILQGSKGVPVSMRVFDGSAVKISVLVVVAVIGFLLFDYMSFGKHCRSIGCSVNAARQSGVNVEKVRMVAFILSGVLASLAGFFSLCRTCTASTSTGDGFEFDVLLAVLFGGVPLTGGWGVKYRAAVIGSLAIGILQNGMSLMGINGNTQQIIQGVILIVVVVISFDRKSAAVVK